jgi:hypothetical protein
MTNLDLLQLSQLSVVVAHLVVVVALAVAVGKITAVAASAEEDVVVAFCSLINVVLLPLLSLLTHIPNDLLHSIHARYVVKLVI